LPFLTTALSLLLALFTLGLVLLALLLTSTASPLSIRKAGNAQKRGGDRRRHGELF
jgi:hypothetical protein